MMKAALRSGDGERRVDTRYELILLADVRRACGDAAGQVVVTDLSRSGFNMQSRWDFAPQEGFAIDLPPQGDCRARVAWHDPLIGAYGCRFDDKLAADALDAILTAARNNPPALPSAPPGDERRGEPRFAMRVPVLARRGTTVEREIAVLTSLSASGFRMRSSQSYDLKQTVYVELGPHLTSEARIVRHNATTGEYGGRLTYPLSPDIVQDLVMTNVADSGQDDAPA